MKNVDWKNVEDAKEFAKLTPGGYVAVITDVDDVTDKEYLKIYYDIAEGDFKGYYRQLYDAKDFWGGYFFKSYKDTALPFFKAMLTALGNSNSNFKFGNDIRTLPNKYIGLVLGEEEYYNNNNELKTRLYVAQVHSVDVIRKGGFKVPAIKKIKNNNNSPFDGAGFAPLSDDEDLPF